MLQSPQAKAPGLAHGVSEDVIARFVPAFYDAIRRDDLLGPIFEHHVSDWPAHIARLCDFWSSVALMSGRYKGRPMPVHAAISGIDAAHFERWLRIFREVAAETCEPEAAAFLIERSQRIAQSLQAGIAQLREDAGAVRCVAYR